MHTFLAPLFYQLLIVHTAAVHATPQDLPGAKALAGPFGCPHDGCRLLQGGLGRWGPWVLLPYEVAS